MRLAVLNPEMKPPFVTDALHRMSKRLWFLHGKGGLYRFAPEQLSDLAEPLKDAVARRPTGKLSAAPRTR